MGIYFDFILVINGRQLSNSVYPHEDTLDYLVANYYYFYHFFYFYYYYLLRLKRQAESRGWVQGARVVKDNER